MRFFKNNFPINPSSEPDKIIKPDEFDKISSILQWGTSLSFISRKDLELAEVPVDDSLKGNKLNVFDVGAFQADAIIVFDKPSDVISEKLLKQPGIAANKKKVSVIKWSDDEMPDYQMIADEMDQIINNIPD